MTEAALQLHPDAMLAQLWRELVEGPILLARDKEGELTWDGIRALETRARHASATLVEVPCHRHGGDVDATSAILLGFAWTAASVRPYLATLKTKRRLLGDLDAAMDVIAKTEALSASPQGKGE